jgi:hypothetical protein
MAQELVPVDESVHRPARLRGGATVGEPLAAAPPLGGLLEEPLSHVKRSLLLQAASSAVQARIERVAMRVAMDAGMDLKRGDGSVYQNVATVSGRCPPGLRRPINAAEAANKASTTLGPEPC